MSFSSKMRKRDGGDRLEFAAGADLDFDGMILLFDEFLGDAVDARFSSAKGSDGSAAVAAINAQVGGVARLASGAGAGGTVAVNGSSLTHELNWKASQGGPGTGNTDAIRLEARLKVDAITNVQIFAGFTDTKADSTLEIPFSLSSDVLTSTATDAAGFLFDTGADIDHWHLCGVANDVDGTTVTTALAPVAATFVVLKIEISTAGLARFWINDQEVGQVASAVTTSVALTPILIVSALAAAQRNLDVDYLRVVGSRV